MRDINLLQLALGVAPPWSVTRGDFDPAARRLDIHIDFKPGSRFACPACGAADCPTHDTDETTWRHLNFFQHQAYLHARVPRVRCTACGVKKIAVSWARPGSGFTLLFEALLMAMVTAMPVNAVARLVGEHDTRIWRVIHHYVDEARENTDAAEVKRVAFDETAARRGHDYITLFVDIDPAAGSAHRPAEPGVVRRYHLCADGEGVCVSGRGDGLVQPAGVVVAGVDYDGFGFLRGGAARGHGAARAARNF